MMKKIIVLTILLLTVFTTIAVSQTRRKSTVRRKTTTAKKIVQKVKAPTDLNCAATKTASGLIYTVTQSNSAGQQLKAGDTVIVNYTGLLTSGAKFDSSLDGGQPFRFSLGAGRVIKGWDEGFQKLRVGEKAILTIPPQLGYGERGAGGGEIPPNATLIFIVEVIGVQ